MSSPLAFRREHDFISEVHQFCQQMKLDQQGLFQDLTDPNNKTKPEFVFQVQLSFENLDVQTTGSGASKKKAKLEASKKAIIQIVHYLRLSNPFLLAEKYGLRDSDIDDYDRHLTENQLNVKASPFLPTTSFNPTADEFVPSNRTEKPAKLATNSSDKAKCTPSSSAKISSWKTDPKSAAVERPPASIEADSNGETLSSRPAGLLARGPSANGFQHGNGFHRASAASAQVGEQSSSETVPQCEKSSSTPTENLKTKIEKMDLCEMANELDKLKSQTDDQKNWEIAQEAVAYLKKNKDVFDKIIELHQEDAEIGYLALIRKFIKMMPQRKLKYEFRSCEKLGIGRLFYEGQCLQTAYEPSEQSSPSALAALEEACAKKLFYILKLNSLS